MYIGKIETGKSYKKIIFVFMVISILLVAFVTYASLARAKITLTAKKETLTLDFETKIEKKEALELVEAEVIFGQVLEKEMEEIRKIEDIALKEIDEKAKGKVIIYNKRDKDQPLLLHTQLLSDSGVLFRTDERVVVPSHGEVEVGVTADQPGAKGNIEPTHFTVVRIWKDWQKDIYGESKEATSSGTRKAKVVTSESIEKAKNEIADGLYSKILKEWKQKIKENEKILEDSIKKEIVKSEASVKPDTEIEEFEMKVKVKMQALIFDEKGTLDLACTKLKNKVPQDKEFIDFNLGSFSYKVEDINLKESSARLKVHLEGMVVCKLSSQIFDKEKLIGKDLYEVKKYFEQFEVIEKTEVEFSPFWVRSVPSLRDHIEIMVAH